MCEKEGVLGTPSREVTSEPRCPERRGWERVSSGKLSLRSCVCCTAHTSVWNRMKYECTSYNLVLLIKDE